VDKRDLNKKKKVLSFVCQLKETRVKIREHYGIIGTTK